MRCNAFDNIAVIRIVHFRTVERDGRNMIVVTFQKDYWLVHLISPLFITSEHTEVRLFDRLRGFSAAEIDIANVLRVSAGSMIPSSQIRAEA